jgi:RsiW-degrading membrane proteinase PrsW (M82 family)
MDETPSFEDKQVTHPPESVWLRAAKVLALVGGVLAVMIGLAAGVVSLLFALLPTQMVGPRSLSNVTAAFSVFVLGVGLGSGLVFHALRALQSKPSSRLRLPSPAWFLLAFVLVLVLGTVSPIVIRESRFVFPLFYLLGILLPVLAILAAVQRRLERRGLAPAWRDSWLGLSTGALLSTGGATILELGIVLFPIALAVILIVLSPAVAARFREWLPILNNPNWSGQTADLEALLSSPVVLGLVFFVLVIAAPLIEEALKAIGVVLLIFRRPSSQQALWWGLLGGAGFTLTEGLLNGSLSMGQMSWSELALVRVGTTLMHCTAGALMGLGWRRLLLDRQVGGWLKRYVQALLLHAVWNGLTLGLVATSALGGNALQAAAMVFFGLLLLLEVVVLGVLLWRLTGTPPSSPTESIGTGP